MVASSNRIAYQLVQGIRYYLRHVYIHIFSQLLQTNIRFSES